MDLLYQLGLVRSDRQWSDKFNFERNLWDWRKSWRTQPRKGHLQSSRNQESVEKALLQVQINSHYISVYKSLYSRCEIVGKRVLMGHLVSTPPLVGAGQGILTESPTKAAHNGDGIPACWEMETHYPHTNSYGSWIITIWKWRLK